MLDVLAIGLAHLLATSHVCSGLIHYLLALCIIVGALLGSACHCHWPILVITGGPICCHLAACVVIGPSSLLLDCHLAHTHHHWWAYWLSLGRAQGLLIVIGMLPGLFPLGLIVGLSYSSWVVGSSFPHAGIIRMTMVGVGYSCLI